MRVEARTTRLCVLKEKQMINELSEKLQKGISITMNGTINYPHRQVTVTKWKPIGNVRDIQELISLLVDAENIYRGMLKIDIDDFIPKYEYKMDDVVNYLGDGIYILLADIGPERWKLKTIKSRVHERGKIFSADEKNFVPVDPKDVKFKSDKEITDSELLKLYNIREGDVLVSCETVNDKLPDRIRITSIGEERFLCRWDFESKGSWKAESGATSLDMRYWRKE